ncbi:MAG TPA: redoxin domain-containing protein [Acidobacteriaceae bacterium]|jgi:hypothetical protein|nr:redoxin domain-containing protein [Acidobacteriaceae bacterium]
MIPLLVCALAVASGAQTFGVDLNNRPVTQLVSPGSRAAVLFFLASDCPISNRYIPEIQRLEHNFAPQGIQFWWVYPNPDETTAKIQRHQEQFHIHTNVVIDNKQRLTTMARATITPEVAIFVPVGSRLREVYHGRIDNRYLALGRQRPAATRHDLEDALSALTANRPVATPGGQPVGCSIIPRSAP